MLFLGIIILCFLNNGFAGKPESLFHLIKHSPQNVDIEVYDATTCIQCKPCQITLSYETTNHFSNVMRHLSSDSHRMNAQWIVKEQCDTFKIISSKQKTTLHDFSP